MTPAEIQTINRRQFAEWEHCLNATNHVPVVLVSVQRDGQGAGYRVHPKQGATLDELAAWLDAAHALAEAVRDQMEPGRPAEPLVGSAELTEALDEIRGACLRRRMIPMVVLGPVQGSGGKTVGVIGPKNVGPRRLTAMLKDALTKAVAVLDRMVDFGEGGK